MELPKKVKKELKRKAAKLAETYSKEICSKEDFVQEINYITMVYNANFGRKQLGALELLNALAASSTMSQHRRPNLARFSIESDCKQIDFDNVIRIFAKQNARKATLF